MGEAGLRWSTFSDVDATHEIIIEELVVDRNISSSFSIQFPEVVWANGI